LGIKIVCDDCKRGMDETDRVFCESCLDRIVEEKDDIISDLESEIDDLKLERDELQEENEQLTKGEDD